MLVCVECKYKHDTMKHATGFLPIDHTDIIVEGGQKEHQRGSKVHEVF